MKLISKVFIKKLKNRNIELKFLIFRQLANMKLQIAEQM